jgi:hypothetical protein
VAREAFSLPGAVIGVFPGFPENLSIPFQFVLASGTFDAVGDLTSAAIFNSSSENDAQKTEDNFTEPKRWGESKDPLPTSLA